MQRAGVEFEVRHFALQRFAIGLQRNVQNTVGWFREVRNELQDDCEAKQRSSEAQKFGVESLSSGIRVRVTTERKTQSVGNRDAKRVLSAAVCAGERSGDENDVNWSVS